MATIEITLDDEKIQDLFGSDQGLAALLQPALNQLLQAEMTHHLQAEPGERTEQRRGYRNGSYERKLTTRVGTLELEVPRDRAGTFSTELFERYQRSEKALVTTLMEMVVQGVSTRKVKKITGQLCGRRFTKSTVSELAKGLDEQVEAWRERKLENYPFLVCDAMQVKVRRQGAVRATTVLIVVGISEKGYREVLGMKVSYGETGLAWKELFEELKGRGLTGVEVVTSDAHEGLKEAILESFPGSMWQRCQAHFRRNVADKTPSTYKGRMHQVLDSILQASSPKKARQELESVYEELNEKASGALAALESGLDDATAVLALPTKYRRRLRTTNMVERFIEEIRRREKVVRIFPNARSVWRLVGALCAERHEEWSTGRRYLTMGEYIEWRAAVEAENLPKAA